MEAEPHVIAEGTYDDGLSWVILAWWRGAQLRSKIRVAAPDGRILHGGGGAGPPGHPGRLMHVSTGGSDKSPYCLLAQVHPVIRRVELITTAGKAMNVPVHDSAGFPGVRFASLIVPRDLRLSRVSGFGADGEELERFDLAFHQEAWHTGPGKHGTGTAS
jgi:hypothetical protein